MKKILGKVLLYTMSIVLAGMIGGCSDVDYYQGGKEEIKKDDFFNFSTTRNDLISINYGTKDCPIVFYLYEENPLEEIEGQIRLKEIAPLYAGVTDAKGYFSSKVIFPSILKEVWLYTDYMGVSSPVKLTATASGFSFDNAEYLRKSAETKAGTRGTTSAGYDYPEGYGILGEWDAAGTPDYKKIGQAISEDIINRVSYTYSNIQKRTILKRYPHFATLQSMDTKVVASTGINLYYLSDGNSTLRSTLAYYTYKTGEKVDPSSPSVKKTIIFPYIRDVARSGTLTAGKTYVSLRYWNEETGEYQENFPAGVSIGWILLPNAFQNGPVKVNLHPCYSNPIYNEEGEQRLVALVDSESNSLISLGFEDQKPSAADWDYRDAIFNLEVEVPGAVDTDNYPSLPENVTSNDEVEYSSKGTVAFEDQWPNKGDYDMNDVVINYLSKKVKKVAGWPAADINKVCRTIDYFTPVNNGADFTNGFGYQIDNLDGVIESITLELDGVEQQISLEEGQQKPVLILFDDIRPVLGKTFKITTLFKKGSAATETSVQAPYNPFIFVGERAHEVHLTGFLPTDKADDSLRGTGNDIREDTNHQPMYYVSSDNMPFAIHISGTYFDYPDEKQSITIKYPDFASWVKNKGSNDTGWYLK